MGAGERDSGNKAEQRQGNRSLERTRNWGGEGERKVREDRSQVQVTWQSGQKTFKNRDVKHLILSHLCCYEVNPLLHFTPSCRMSLKTFSNLYYTSKSLVDLGGNERKRQILFWI